MEQEKDQTLTVESKEVEKVTSTKTKHPKRVEAGKRLAEYNKRKKEALKQIPEMNDSVSTPDIDTADSYSISHLACGVVVITVGFISYLYFKRPTVKPPVAATRIKQEPEIDVFAMD